jgi:hypothetical protein
MFRPRLLADGRICCSNSTALCPKCKAQHAAEGRSVAADPEEEASSRLSSNASFRKRYAAEQTRMFADLRAATRKIEAEITAPTMRALEDPDEIPNGYARALEDRQPTQHDITPDCWPGYDPYGMPADSYTLAIALRHLQKEDATHAHVAAAARPENLHYDQNGVPDGYAAGIAKMRSANR